MNRRAFRYWSVIALLGIFTLVIVIRYASLALSPTATDASAFQEVERGPITDRSGRYLALDSPLYNIAVWKPEIQSDAFPAEARRLAAILGIEDADLLGRLKTEKADFFYLRKRVQPQVARAIQEGRATGAFSGIVVEKVAGRLYPEKRLASHLVGFVGDANKGLAGVEARYDEDLSGGAKAVRPADPRVPFRGNSVSLTIDSDIQFSLEEVARKAISDTGAQSVILVAADARSGEILAYVAEPDFDPNEYLMAPAEAWYDWPSVYAYEPGSVFKVFSMASVLDLGGADTRSTFYCDGAYHRTAPSGEPITIKCLAVHGTVDIEHILEYSCNAGAAYASDTVQALDFYERLRGFGFGSRLGLALAGESPGALRSPETWSLRSKPTIAMGQEILVTALQMTTAATAIANGGVMLKPIIVRKVAAPDGTTVYENAPQVVRRAVSAETASSILASMETVSSASGTGRRAKVKDVRMAVKTGTAQMIDPQTRRYSEKDYIASTLAIFPAEEPRIVLYLAIVKPTGESYYGGRIAAPVIKDATEAILSLTDLPRGASPAVLHPGRIAIPRAEAASIGDTMPDLTGTPKRLLLPLLARKDLIVHIEGEGYVSAQRPAAGTPVPPGTEIFLELK